MSTSVPEHEFNLEEIAAALFAAKGIESGLWRLAAKIRFAAITAAAKDGANTTPMPTGVVSFEGLALFRSDAPGDLIFDAAKLRAKKQPTKSARKAPAKRTRTT